MKRFTPIRIASWSYLLIIDWIHAEYLFYTIHLEIDQCLVNKLMLKANYLYILSIYNRYQNNQSLSWIIEPFSQHLLNLFYLFSLFHQFLIHFIANSDYPSLKASLDLFSMKISISLRWKQAVYQFFQDHFIFNFQIYLVSKKTRMNWVKLNFLWQRQFQDPNYQEKHPMNVNRQLHLKSE